MLRFLGVGLILILITIGAVACSSSSRWGSSSKGAHDAPVTGSPDTERAANESFAGRDGDGDNDRPDSRWDPDNDKVLHAGSAADPAERHILIALVKHYYALAAADDGQEACSLLYWPVMEAVVEAHDEGNGPPSLRGNTCAQIVTKLFTLHHRELVLQNKEIEITEIQERGRLGFVRLRFASTPERLVSVHRDHGVWQVNVLLDELGV